MKRWFWTIVAMTLATVPLQAQGPRGADSLSPKAVAESLAVLDMLKAQIGTDSADAASWYRIGMISWALADRARAQPSINGLDWTRLGRQADTSLRIAAQLAPKVAQYRLMVGRYLLVSGVSITRFASGGFFEDALTVARTDSNGPVHAEAAIENGRTHWRRYDALVNRRLATSPAGVIRSIAQATQAVSSDDNLGAGAPLKNVKSALDLNTIALPPEYSGLNDYRKAEDMFREAYAADPISPRPFQQLAMLLADKERWQELSELARGRLAKTPWDPWGWLVLGLGEHRQRKGTTAAAAFDSALTYMDPYERARLDRIERILRKADVGTVQKGTGSDQVAVRRLYWLFADPLWSREGNESRIEFLARVTFSELRWTVDEMGVRGVDTDRGNIYVRYGPPNLVASFGGDPSQQVADISTVWVYNSGLMFTFQGAPTFATARIPIDDQAYVAEVEELQPVRWDNLTNFKIDSIPTQVVRFRAAADSIEIFVAAEPNVERIKNASQGKATPRADFWLLAGGTVLTYRDSATLSSAGIRSWTKRVPAGNYVFRVEASADAATIGGRATAPVVAGADPLRGFGPRGWGLSDLLVTKSAEPKAGMATRRWRDLAITPIAGSVQKDGSITLVWENYDFGAKDNQSEYKVAVILERERSTIGRIAAKVVSQVGGAVGIERTDDRITMRFDRNMPAGAVIPDYVTISLAEAPPGPYRLALEITDQITKRTMTRSTNIVIQK